MVPRTYVVLLTTGCYSRSIQEDLKPVTSKGTCTPCVYMIGTTMWVLGIEPASSARAAMLLITEPSLQSMILIFTGDYPRSLGLQQSLLLFILFCLTMALHSLLSSKSNKVLTVKKMKKNTRQSLVIISKTRKIKVALVKITYLKVPF